MLLSPAKIDLRGPIGAVHRGNYIPGRKAASQSGRAGGRRCRSLLRSNFASFGRALRLRQDIPLVGRGQIAIPHPREIGKRSETTLIFGDDSKCLSSAHFTALQLGRLTLADHMFQIPCTASSAPNMSRTTRYAGEDDRPRYVVRNGWPWHGAVPGLADRA